MSYTISREKYAAMYGPTTGDKVRLADTDLVLEIEKDYTSYGDEAKFGGGKTLRDGMGQASEITSVGGALDLVLTNAIVMDPVQGIVKADIGIKDGRIVGLGKAGNPDIMEGVTPGLTVGASTEALAAEGLIVTPGGLDTHIHFISPQQIDTALYSGITTMIGGGTGPADGTNATTCTPGPWNLREMLRAADAYPMNLGFLGKGNCSSLPPLAEQIEAGAMGLKIHEDWGAMPACAYRMPMMSRRPSIRTRSMRQAVSRTRSMPSAVGPSTRITRRGPAAAMLRTSYGRQALRTSCHRRQIRRCLLPRTHSMNILTCSWYAITSTAASPRTWPLPIRASVLRRLPRKTSCMTWASSR